MPRNAINSDCIVVGGGLVGMLSARLLAQAGLSVALVEQGELCRESSWAGGGIISPLVPWDYPDAVNALVQRSQQIYPRLAEELLSETGIDPEWTSSGMLLLGTARDDGVAAWHERFPCALESVEAGQLAGLEPALAADFTAALRFPDIAQVRNPRLGRAVAGSLERLGVQLVTETPVTGLKIESGQVRGVDTPQGVLAADRVVIAGGAWSGRILERYIPGIPVEPVLGQMIMYEATPGLLRHIIVHDGYYVIPRRDGLILAGSTLEHTGYDKHVTAEARDMLAQRAVRLLPALADYPVVRHWSGLRPGSATGIPLVCAVPAIGGLYLNAGHYRNGVGMAPASARLLADILLGQPASVDPSPYRLDACAG